MQGVHHEVPAPLRRRHLLHRQGLQTVQVVHFLGSDLSPDWEYMVDLYEAQGLIDTPNKPVFFAMMTYSTEIQYIFEEFGFKSAPNLVVSKPQMAVVSEIEKKTYIQGFKWQISYTDGHVTTHKMLDFVNQRTGRDVFYKPTVFTMFKMFFGFIGVALVGVFAYTRLKFLWNHWLFWLAGSLVPLPPPRSSTPHAVRASSTTSSTTCPSPAATRRQARPSSSQEATGSSTDWRGGSCPFRSP